MKKFLISVQIFFYIFLLVFLIFLYKDIKSRFFQLENKTEKIEVQFKEYKDKTALSYSKFVTKKDLQKSVTQLSREIKKEIKKNKEKVTNVTTGDTQGTYTGQGESVSYLHFEDKKIKVDVNKKEDKWLWKYKINQNFHFDIIGTKTKDAYKVRVKITDKDTGQVLEIKNLETKYNFEPSIRLEYFVGMTSSPSVLGGVRYGSYSLFLEYDFQHNENKIGFFKSFQFVKK